MASQLQRTCWAQQRSQTCSSRDLWSITDYLLAALAVEANSGDLTCVSRLAQVARLLALVPPWVRVYRIQRDIPMPLVTSGVEKGNLRELALARMGQLGLRCRDVRTREVGIQVRRLPLLPCQPPCMVLAARSIHTGSLSRPGNVLSAFSARSFEGRAYCTSMAGCLSTGWSQSNRAHDQGQHS